jgi:hypothetical protein
MIICICIPAKADPQVDPTLEKCKDMASKFDNLKTCLLVKGPEGSIETLQRNVDLVTILKGARGTEQADGVEEPF